MPDRMTKTPKHRPLDDETAAALTLFNTYLVADREQQARERALRKAEKAKDDAAAAVRKLNDRKAPASETAAAEAAYREAAETLRRLRNGDTADPDDADEEAGDDTAAATDDKEAATEDQAEATTGVDPAAATEAEVTTDDNTDEISSVGVEASVGHDDLAGDEPAGVAG